MKRIAFSNLAAPGWTLERTLEAVGEYGYDGLELRLLDGEPIDPASVDAETRRGVGKALARTAVTLVSLDTSIELARPFERGLPAALELASDWGAPTVRVFGGEAPALHEIARRLEPALDRAEQLGVTIALETHDSFASAALVAELLQRVGIERFAALWDVHHPYRVGESPEEVVRALGASIHLVHVKDARRRGDGWELVPLGDGEVPVRESLAALHAAGYDGWLTVEWEKRWHPELDEPEVALPRDLETLQRWLGGYENSGTSFRRSASSSIVSSDGRDS
ncbi:MAG TPA: sugar phosphate isomerase/epimerase family protein [Gaiellaceae bacterium]|nr:sugar phosphate isomerase/epimerase family protein [Gaiellaceae bacterium]